MPKRSKAVALRVIVLVVCIAAQASYLAGFTPKAATRMPRLDELASGFAATLEVSRRVEVVIVPRNDLVVSVEPLLAPEQGYRVIFEQKFFDLLNEEEIAGALAHELGHVWIYTHFPFLQTEALANEIALKVAPRRALESLYDKLWAYTGVKGNIEELLGPAPRETVSR